MIPRFDSHSCTSNVTNDDVEPHCRWPKINRRHGAELWRPFFVCYTLPFRFCHFRVRFSCLHSRFVDLLEERMKIHARRNTYLNFIPHPLSHGGEVEIFTSYGITVQERNSPSRRVATGSPISRF